MDKPTSKTKVLTTHWTFYFWQYLFGILLLPLIIGGFLILYTRKKQREMRYILGDTTITAQDREYSQTFDLINLTGAEVHQSNLQKKFSIGVLILKKEGATMKLKGIKNPHSLKEAILTVNAHLKARQQKKPKPEPKIPGRKMSDDRLDYLTGLWQQGLISDSDYEKERKHFE